MCLYFHYGLRIDPRIDKISQQHFQESAELDKPYIQIQKVYFVIGVLDLCVFLCVLVRKVERVHVSILLNLLNYYKI